MKTLKELQIQYTNILSNYLENKTERNLYIGQNFIRQLIQKKITPEEVIDIHKYAIEQIYPNLTKEISNSYDFLIEIMVHYGLAVMEHQILLEQQEEFQNEMKTVGKISNNLPDVTLPKVKEVDIGMVSIPIRKMNGDYFNF